MHILADHDLPSATLPGIDHKTLAGRAQGLSHLSVWRQTIAGGGATPPHRHDCEEVVLVAAGRGRLLIDGAAHDFGPHTTLVIPPDIVHQIVNVGDEPMQLTAAFSTSPVEVFLPDGQPLALPWAS